MNKIIQGDCLEEMSKMEENSISCIVTDPPYGLKFMGKSWDHGIPGIPFWEEALRICKPGSYLLAFGGTRTYHRLTCAIEDAGWEIRDCLMWIYGSGFPKSHNHFGIEGYGTALKPAYEPIIMAMKPCDGTFKQNAEWWGQAGINIDRCRIETQDLLGRMNNSTSTFNHKNKTPFINNSDGKGRWPANVIFDEEAAKILDEQSGISKSSGGRSGHTKAFSGGFRQEFYGDKKPGLGDSGGASRFFYCAKASPRERNEGLDGLPESPIRRNDRLAGSHDIFNTEGCGRNTDNKPQKNNHPTIKPLKLMEYLIKLVMPTQNGVLLDPFAGSGTTILAAKRLGFNAIGIEKMSEYCDIAKVRIA